jgi:hypothetical protein
MSTNIAALPPPSHHIPHRPENDDEIDVPEYAFGELWQDKNEGLTFGDVLDIINPLHHIPVVSTIYRMATEDDIGIGSRLLGGALFGGPLGVLITGITAIFEDVTGGSIDEHVATLWNTLDEEGKGTSQLAASVNKDPVPAALPLMEDDYAAVATRPAQAVGEPKPITNPVPIAASAHIVSPHTIGPAQLSPQPVPRPPVTVAPLTAVHRVHSRPAHVQQAQPVTADREAESQRIAKAIELAQRSQAGLLLASLGADSAEQPRDAGDRRSPQPVQPFKAHPYLLPRGAPPQLISRAMEQAMAKYQATLQQRSGAINAAPAGPTLAPIQ